MSHALKLLLICVGIIWGVCNVIVIVVILSRVTATMDDAPSEKGKRQ